MSGRQYHVGILDSIHFEKLLSEPHMILIPHYMLLMSDHAQQ